MAKCKDLNDFIKDSRADIKSVPGAAAFIIEVDEYGNMLAMLDEANAALKYAIGPDRVNKIEVIKASLDTINAIARSLDKKAT